jgi:hypothetical protein
LHGEKTILTLRRSWNSGGTFLNGYSDGFVFETWGRIFEIGARYVTIAKRSSDVYRTDWINII